ncbi:MAG: hypothetical protein ACYTEQ_09350 [Planctomycetota bacterium]|jgi:hypothetical protein
MLKLDDKTYPYMRPAAWRWVEAQDRLATPGVPLSAVAHDHFLFQATRFLRSSRNITTSVDYYRKRYPEVHEAFQIYTSNRAHGYRWFLEAALASDATDDAILEEIPFTCGQDALDAYRALFFDIDDYRDKDWCVQANLLATSRVGLHHNNDYDFTWKLIAYTWGFDSFKQFTALHEPLDKELEEWMHEIMSKRYTVHSFHVTSDMRQAYNIEVATILDKARTSYYISQEAQSKVDSMIEEEDIHALLKTIHFTMMHSEMKPEAVEQRLYGDYNVYANPRNSQN